ncbi:ead/Ea22-like family protein [Klebsiella quasipneumoniae]|uniref:ead/Ea22-like family protein n=1 Tax=Klebsiella quasipneumoniae TaxID=1463165 RepID=UPI001CD48E20|nr:ead/Ea22-like family protein [Klebsiella quasipneumoniae]
MTDITELAQSLKAAAENAIGAHERLAAYPYGEIIDISQHEGEQIDIDITDLNEFNKEANPENILALVEALEKAQRANAAQDDHINQQQDRIDQLEKGHQEAAKQINSWRRMAKQNIAEREKDIAELDAARQRIAELESRTVTVKLPEPPGPMSVGARTVYFGIVADVVSAFQYGLTAAGIKVEAE